MGGEILITKKVWRDGQGKGGGEEGRQSKVASEIWVWLWLWLITWRDELLPKAESQEGRENAYGEVYLIFNGVFIFFSFIPCFININQSMQKKFDSHFNTELI